MPKPWQRIPSGVTKAELDRLAAEFRDELDALGVRVAELERYADKVVWHGKIEYTYEQTKTDPLNSGTKTKDKSNGFIFRFEPTAHVNDHWTVNARIDAEVDMKKTRRQISSWCALGLKAITTTSTSNSAALNSAPNPNSV